MAFLASYGFLLRVPSECLPMCAHKAPDGVEAPVFLLRDGEAILRLPFHKNRLYPSEIVRRCWCAEARNTCPVHSLGTFFRQQEEGARPFVHLNPAQALLSLRELLCELGIQNAMLYRLHDFRRGHANDLWKAGGILAEILEAGDWSSAAFLSYLNRVQLERDRVDAAHVGEADVAAPSDSEGGVSADEE